MPAWIGKPALLAIHERVLADTGGRRGLRDEAALDAVLARPLQLLARGRPDLADLAAALADGLVRQAPFIDGNPRTAIVCGMAFLRLNGVPLRAPPEETARAVLALGRGTGEADFAAWLRRHLPLHLLTIPDERRPQRVAQRWRTA